MKTMRGEPTILAHVMEWQRHLLGQKAYATHKNNTFPIPGVKHIIQSPTMVLISKE